MTAVSTMASSRRIASLPVISRIQSKLATGYVCSNCQRRCLASVTRPRTTAPAPAAYNASQQRRRATNRPENDDFEGSFADRLRKKIWGTDNPPGQRNPYVRETQEELEERLAEEEERIAFEEQTKMKEAEDFAKIAGQGTSETRFDDTLPEGEIEYDERPPRNDARDVQTSSGGYKPAMTWRGLRHVPDWKVVQQAPKFAGFLSPQKIDHPEAINSIIQRALIEIWTLKQSSLPLVVPNNVGNPSAEFASRLMTAANFDHNSTGESVLRFLDPNLQEDVLASLRYSPGQDLDGEASADDLLEIDETLLVGAKRQSTEFIESEVRSEPAQEITATEADLGKDIPEIKQSLEDVPAVREERHLPGSESAEPLSSQNVPSEEIVEEKGFDTDHDVSSWRAVSLEDPDLKFAVLKRVMQLTGIRIPDPDIPRLRTGKDLLAYLVKPPKPLKLAEKLGVRESLVNAPNLQLYDKRWTEKAREDEIGRWKVITAELTKRGLPHDTRDIKLSRRARKAQ